MQLCDPGHLSCSLLRSTVLRHRGSLAWVQKPGAMRSPETSWIELLIMLRDRFLAQLETASMIKIGFLIRESGPGCSGETCSWNENGSSRPLKEGVSVLNIMSLICLKCLGRRVEQNDPTGRNGSNLLKKGEWSIGGTDFALWNCHRQVGQRTLYKDISSFCRLAKKIYICGWKEENTSSKPANLL